VARRPAIVLTWNVLPFAVYLVLLGRLIDAGGKTDFGKLLAFAVAAVGTFLLTFSNTLNNHLPAAFCVLFAVYPLLRAVGENRDMTPGGYGLCGFFRGARRDVRAAGAGAVRGAVRPAPDRPDAERAAVLPPLRARPVRGAVADELRGARAGVAGVQRVRRAVVQLRGEPLGEARHPGGEGDRLQRRADRGVRVPPPARAPRVVQPDPGVGAGDGRAVRERDPERAGGAEDVRPTEDDRGGRPRCSRR
jgi:hypothetical protein